MDKNKLISFFFLIEFDLISNKNSKILQEL